MPPAGQEYQAVQGHEGVSGRGDKTTLHLPIEGFSSDDDDASPTKESNKSQRDVTPRRSPPKTGEHTTIHTEKARRPWRRFCARLIPSKRACILIAVVLAAVLGAAIGGGAWVYKSAPKDGLSPPWYPTPRGGTAKTWEKSYQLAREMVGKMSLVEKVNITTGTGYVMNLSSLICAQH
jgi:hypothetical protein